MHRHRTTIAAAPWLFLPAALLLAPAAAQAQDAHRMSLASADAAALQKQSQGPGYYNLELGPVALRFQSEVQLEANDNVNYTRTNRIADLGFRPGIDVALNWPISEQNDLYFDIGIGYITWLKTSTLDHLDITPNSQLAYHIYVQNFVIELHERLSLTQDQTQNPTLSDTGNYSQFQNDLGTSVIWDLNKLILSVGYDHVNLVASGSGLDYTTHSSELFNSQITYAPKESIRAGLEVGGGTTTYDTKRLNDNTELSVGPYYQAQLSKFVHVRLSAGVAAYRFTPNAFLPNPQNINAYYADMSITHTVNRWLNYTFSAGHQFQLGVTADTVDTYYAHLAANWKLIRNVTLVPHLDYTHGKESGGELAQLQTLDLYSGGVRLGYQLTKKLQAAAEYDLNLKKADPASLDYIQNRLVLDFNYSF